MSKESKSDERVKRDKVTASPCSESEDEILKKIEELFYGAYN